jgi:CheY-like chemotaxis protein
MTGRIHVVDADALVRDSLRDLLVEEGYTVTTAVDGKDALDRLSDVHPCLILLDLKMPRMDGWEFLARRDAERASSRDGDDAPVVLLSGMAYIRDAPGVADFLAKPIRVDQLLDCVRRFCRNDGSSGPKS